MTHGDVSAVASSVIWDGGRAVGSPCTSPLSQNDGRGAGGFRRQSTSRGTYWRFKLAVKFTAGNPGASTQSPHVVAKDGHEKGIRFLVGCVRGGGGGHAHGNAARQVMDGLRTEVCGQPSKNRQTTPTTTSTSPNTPTIGRR